MKIVGYQIILRITRFVTLVIRLDYQKFCLRSTSVIHVIQSVAVGLSTIFYVVHLDHFNAIIVSIYLIILLVLPLSSNIVDFILPGWRQIYIATT